MAMPKVIKEAEERTIDSAFLFQSFLVVPQIGELELGEMMKYEISSQPSSLFEDKHWQRKPDKSTLLEDMSKQSSSVEGALPQCITKIEHYI